MSPVQSEASASYPRNCRSRARGLPTVPASGRKSGRTRTTTPGRLFPRARDARFSVCGSGPSIWSVREGGVRRTGSSRRRAVAPDRPRATGAPTPRRTTDPSPAGAPRRLAPLDGTPLPPFTARLSTAESGRARSPGHPRGRRSIGRRVAATAKRQRPNSPIRGFLLETARSVACTQSASYRGASLNFGTVG